MAVDKIIPNNLIYTKEKYSYDSVIEAQKDLGLEVGNLIRVFGYNTANDGLGASYEVSLTSGGSGIKLDNGYYLVEIPNSNGSKKMDKGTYEGKASDLKVEIDEVNAKVETIIGSSDLERVHQVNHGYTINPIVWDGSLWISNDTETPAEAIAVKDDEDNFFVVRKGTVLIPNGTVDENGNALVNDEYYLFSNTNSGKLSITYPETGIYQIYLQARQRGQDMVADIDLGEASYISPTVFNKESASSLGFLLDSDIASQYAGGQKKVAAAEDTKLLNDRVKVLEGTPPIPEGVLTNDNIKFSYTEIQSDFDLISGMTARSDHNMLQTAVQEDRFKLFNDSTVGLNFDWNNVLYIQDVGTKYVDKVYIDRNDKKIYKCVTETTSVNNDGSFEDISNNGIANSLSNGYTVHSGKITYDNIEWHWERHSNGTLILRCSKVLSYIPDVRETIFNLPINFIDNNYNVFSSLCTKNIQMETSFGNTKIHSYDLQQNYFRVGSFRANTSTVLTTNFLIVGRWKAYDLSPKFDLDNPDQTISLDQDLSNTDFSFMRLYNTNLIKDFNANMIKIESPTGLTVNIREIRSNGQYSNIFYGLKSSSNAVSGYIKFTYEDWEKGYLAIGRCYINVK